VALGTVALPEGVGRPPVDATVPTAVPVETAVPNVVRAERVLSVGASPVVLHRNEASWTGLVAISAGEAKVNRAEPG
jgi:hypothetical protein